MDYNFYLFLIYASCVIGLIIGILIILLLIKWLRR